MINIFFALLTFKHETEPNEAKMKEENIMQISENLFLVDSTPRFVRRSVGHT